MVKLADQPIQLSAGLLQSPFLTRDERIFKSRAPWVRLPPAPSRFEMKRGSETALRAGPGATAAEWRLTIPRMRGAGQPFAGTFARIIVTFVRATRPKHADIAWPTLRGD